LIADLPPFPVAGPLAVAGLLLAVGHRLPARIPDAIAFLTAIGAGAVCVLMAMHTAGGPLVYWFGGWTPRPGIVIGIGFLVDRVGATVAAFIAFLFAATLVFAWGFFDEVHAHFHVLMLPFMAGMIGFCLTHDLFNLFVWFEVISIAGFALTGYTLRSSALEGAMNFTVINTIGSYLLLGGIGLAYARVGALDFGALAAGIARMPHDPVISAAFTLLAAGLLIKAAQVPFQFWLADAHSVAPSPVSVIFSGIMVAIGVFGLARLEWSVFRPAPAIAEVTETLLFGLGCASAVVGGAVALMQRHIKRLLAFSTICHVGIMLIGMALLSRSGLAGMLVYLVGQGLVKGALFMIAGILLATRGGIDEIGLRGLGRGIAPAGIAMAAGALLLAGLPIGLMDQGTRLIEAALGQAGRHWALVAILVGDACTGAAVLRVTGRVFLGLGPVAGEERRAPTDTEQEKADRPLWLMLAPAAILLLLALLAPTAAGNFAWRAAAQFMQGGTGAVAPAAAAPPASDLSWLSWLSCLLAIGLAAFGLLRKQLPRRLVRVVERLLDPPLDFLQALHSGRVGDYAMWLAIGLALFAVAFEVA
jgi:multicomponent Na+:H+ antiporter subunit D